MWCTVVGHGEVGHWRNGKGECESESSNIAINDVDVGRNEGSSFSK